MIVLYSGTPGSGKSLHTAERLYYWLRLGKPAICNFDISLDAVSKKNAQRLKFSYWPNNKLTVRRLLDYSRDYFKGKTIREDQIMLVIDEAQLIFNAREWQKKGRDDWLSFFSQHRKYGYYIILVAQFDRMIDRQIRSLIEYEYVHRKVSNFGLKGKLLSVVMGGHMFVAVKVWYAMNEKVGSEFFRSRRKFYRLYDTFGDFGGEDRSRPDRG